MGFNSVYKSLLEIFPQVDSRLLRAVAIEHPKDADLAAGVVLTELIPLLSQSKKSSPATPEMANGPGERMNLEAESEEENLLRHRQLVNVEDVGSSSAPRSINVEMIKSSDCPGRLDLNVPLDDSNDWIDRLRRWNEIKDPNVTEDGFTGEVAKKIFHNISNCFGHEANENLDQGQVHVSFDSKSMISSGICQEMEPQPDSIFKESALSDNNGHKCENHWNEELGESVGSSAEQYGSIISDENPLLENPLTEVEGSKAQPLCHVQGDTSNAKDSLLSELDSAPSATVHEDQNLKQDFCKSETSDVEDEIAENNAVSQSSQVCRTDLLEEIIDEAKTNKSTLFSSMESLINLMREVEVQEKAAEQANMEAANGGSDMLVRVGEYKTMLAHAKEANDMHSGEVYGEKAILATELKELQSRLLGLSEERDKSLAILDEMRQVLEARLSAAEELRKAAEHEKMEKEEFARKALAEQEAMMGEVVNESLRLQQEAEENSKLREFLMDRGRVVDALQGEISVICQDIRLLKEKFDANLPLSKSFTSKETSCMLASSGSSHKSLASADVHSEHSDSSQLLQKNSPAASFASLSSKSSHEEERSKANDDQVALLDDEEWDIFEKDAVDCNLNFCAA